MPKRKKSVRSLIKKLDKVFSEFTRKKEAIDGTTICVTCKVRRPWKELQCGHFISRRHNSVRFDSRNVAPQCPKCNVFRYGEQFLFGRYVDDTYGVGTADELLRKSKESKKWTIHELEELIEFYDKLNKTDAMATR
jgi:hypothetical protein